MTYPEAQQDSNGKLRGSEPPDKACWFGQKVLAADADLPTSLRSRLALCLPQLVPGPALQDEV
jgi:hypothetical protein